MDAPSPLKGFGLPIAIWIVGMSVAVVVLWSVFTRHGEASLAAGVTDGSVRSLVERGATSMLGPGTSGYRQPSSSERDLLVSAVHDLERGDLDHAAGTVAPLGYLVQRVTDTETGHMFVVLRPRDLSAPPGWGTFIFDPDAATGTIVEVPHPRADMFTEHLGAELFLRSGARWLLVAGANRTASDDADVAHEDQSAFEAVHRTVLQGSEVGPIIQLHGFDGASRDYGDAVVSSGTHEPSALTRRIAAALSDLGINTCVHDAAHCTDLGGTTNVQGASTRDAAVGFLHLELAQPLRADPELRVSIADRVTNVIASRGA